MKDSFFYLWGVANRRYFTCVMIHTYKLVNLTGTSFSPWGGAIWVTWLVCCSVTLIYMADQVSWGKTVQFMQFKADQDGFINDTIKNSTWWRIPSLRQTKSITFMYPYRNWVELDSYPIKPQSCTQADERVEEHNDPWRREDLRMSTF